MEKGSQMKSIEEICKELENIPYMKYRQAEIIKIFINDYNYRDAIELGFYHGKSSVLIASIFEEIGEGHLITFDLESARNREPNILQLLSNYNLSHRVTPIFCERSYTWELAKIIRKTQEPIYDFCYLDGAHTWDSTGFGFFLIDMLLKPGGMIIFDDINWTINKSPAYKKALTEGKDPYYQYSEDEKNAPAIRMVMEELVQPRGYVCKEIKEVQWGIAVKMDQESKLYTDQIYSSQTAKSAGSFFEIKDKNLPQQRGVDFFSDLRKDMPTFNPKTIFDVGANVGQSSLLYAEEFPGLQLYCFEPVPATFEKLQQNTKSIPDCLCFNLGFSSKAGVARMLSDLKHPTRSRIKHNEDQHNDGKKVEYVDVYLDTLDHFCEQHNIEKIDLLKIDTEGHDLEVLKGGSSLLRSGRVQVVMVEAGMNEDNKLHAPFFQVFEYLQNLGYYLFAIYEQKEDWINKLPHLRRSNPVFIRRMHKQ